MIIKRLLFFPNNTGIKIPGRTFWAPIFQVKHLATQPANQRAPTVIKRDHAHSPFSNREADETERIRKDPNTAFGVLNCHLGNFSATSVFGDGSFVSRTFSVLERECVGFRPGFCIEITIVLTAGSNGNFPYSNLT